MTVYLIHFGERYEHAGHYLGSTNDLEKRLAQHRAGRGARLMEVITQAGIDWWVVRLWPGGREVEMMLKRWHSGVRLCPICNPAVAKHLARLEPAQVVSLLEQEVFLLEGILDQSVSVEPASFSESL